MVPQSILHKAEVAPRWTTVKPPRLLPYHLREERMNFLAKSSDPKREAVSILLAPANIHCVNRLARHGRFLARWNKIMRQKNASRVAFLSVLLDGGGTGRWPRKPFLRMQPRQSFPRPIEDARQLARLHPPRRLVHALDAVRLGNLDVERQQKETSPNAVGLVRETR